MHPDPEITQVEERLARRRSQLEHTVRDTGRRAVKTLASPAVLLGVVALGFLAGAGVSRRRAPDQKRERAEKSGFAGLLMTGAMWLIKQQLGNPAQIAQLILSRMHRKSSPSDSRPPRTLHSASIPVARAPHAYR
ncbi:MAG TPA: hypothetical protein VI321_02670 [Burkholderiales bacterium]